MEEGDQLPISMDYTLNFGARILRSDVEPLRENDWVKIHSDDDDTLYYAEVTRRVSDRDLIVRVLWDSCAPVLNTAEWSARVYPYRLETRPVTSTAAMAGASQFEG